MRLVKLYDTTLRDGTQAEEISFTVEDKLRIAQKLNELGIHYIEGGWPGSNPKDIDFFKAAKKISLSHSKIAAFGSTRRAKLKVEEDPNIMALLESEAPVVTIFGKTWDLHVKEALRISEEQNLELIYDSLNYLKSKVDEVIYDAEHFFDGFKSNPEYALKTLLAAQDAKADCIVLCDTNGGAMTHEIGEIINKINDKITTPLGIHCHNDAETAVANSIMAVHSGAVHVQGTINGYGERCGNANLCSVIPNIKLKLKADCISDKQMESLVDISRFIDEMANLRAWTHRPYVGKSAFAHKGGVHVSAIQRNAETYEHVKPELVGNRQRVLVSDLSGRSNILHKAKEFNIDVDSKDPAIQKILDDLKELENQGFQFEGAEASFELMMKKALGTKKKFFDLKGFRVIIEKRKEGEESISEATIMLTVNGEVEHTAAEGNGPVNALDNALRKALEKFYPEVKDMVLADYKVRILDERSGTEAMTRVLVESRDNDSRWGTVGVSANIIEASWQALVDSVEFKLHKEKK
jgi:2-isopropylmalate synthase